MNAKIKILDSRQGYDLAAENYDKKEKYLASFEKGKLFELLGDVAGQKILDVGAGTGRVAIQLAKLGGEVTAFDISEEMLNVLKRKNKEVKIVCGDAEDLPFADETFDIIVATFFIVHLRNPQKFFSEACRVLRDGGRFVLTNINQKEPPEVETAKGKIKIESYYHRPEKIVEMLQEELFKVEKEIFVKEKDNWVNQIILARK